MNKFTYFYLIYMISPQEKDKIPLSNVIPNDLRKASITVMEGNMTVNKYIFVNFLHLL